MLLLYINESFRYKVENVVFNNFMSGVLCLTLSLLNYCISGEFSMYLVTQQNGNTIFALKTEILFLEFMSSFVFIAELL